MLRTLLQIEGGLGELTMHLESDEEIRELELVCPRRPIPGIIASYEWRSDKLVLFTREDPDYVPEPAAKLIMPASNVVEPVPSRARLMDMSIVDLQTRAAELNVVHVPGERKAELVARILPAWQKRYEELTKPAAGTQPSQPSQPSAK